MQVSTSPTLLDPTNIRMLKGQVVPQGNLYKTNVAWVSLKDYNNLYNCSKHIPMYNLVNIMPREGNYSCRVVVNVGFPG